MKKTFLIVAALLLSTVASFAASFPQDGGAYRLVNVVTGKAVTNGDVAAHNTYLSVADVNENSLGQEWTFVSLSDKEPLFALYNENYGQAADMALSSGTPGKLLQWEATCTDNQSFLVNVVDEASGIVQLVCKSDQARVLKVQSDGSLLMESGAAGEYTHFRLQYVKQKKVDGIISTRVSIIKAARDVGLFTVQRFFAVDSHSIDTTLESIKSSKPDMIEVMPGIATKVIAKLKGQLNIPIIGGGLVDTADEVRAILRSGASGVSTSKRELWELMK